MLFNSPQFILFLPLVVALYFLIPQKFRWLLLLLASYYFYSCWKVTYAGLMLVSTTIAYFTSIWMERTSKPKKKKVYLLISVLSNLAILFGFKYFNFFNESFRAVFAQYNLVYNVPALNVLLPVGISFYTFQTLSYTIDVYRGQMKAERHFGVFALYVSFFPQLVAGPIERSTRLLPQFFEKHQFDIERIFSGLKLIVWGFFMKLVVADRAAIYVNTIYNNQAEHSGISLIVATVFFAFQIYCDFAGYSSIAIGSARLMGYDLMQNFNRPYFATSIHDFWSRWHISLSTWFRDYLYIPLGGNRVVKWRYYYNLFIVFLVSGLWHGANWTFVVWGALHGLYLVSAIVTKNWRNQVASAIGLVARPGLNRALNIFVTFVLVCFAWIFFRANNVSDAFAIIGKMATPVGNLFIGKPSIFLFSVFGILVLYLSELFWNGSQERFPLFAHPNWVVRQFSYATVVILILLLGVFDGGQFIYFQF